LGTLSKIAIDTAEELKKGVSEEDDYNRCPMDAAEELIRARKIVHDKAPNIIDEFDGICTCSWSVESLVVLRLWDFS
jgi:hypothetical protein